MNEDADYRDMEIGPLLKRLRGKTSLREVRRLVGISNSYLSEIERGERHPGTNVLRRLAALYGVDVQRLMRSAGYLDNEDGRTDNDPLDVDRAYRYVLEDPEFRFGTRPRGPLDLEAKRFIVEMYERLTGKRLLD